MQFNKTWTPAELDATGLAAAVAASAGNVYALTANDAGDSLAHIITFAGKAVTNYATRTVTVTGTDADLNAQTDVIAAGPNGVASVSTAKYFRTVTSVVMSGATSGADTFDIGWTAVAVTQTMGLEKWSAATAAVSCDVTGTCNFTIQQSPEDFYNTPQQNGIWSTLIAGGAIDVTGSSTMSMRCVRGLINSVTAGATLRLCLAQAITP